MANLKVGDKECTFAEIIAVIDTSPASVAILDDWRKFGRLLGTTQVKIHEFSTNLLLDQLKKIDVIENILIDWRSRKARNATLGALLSIIVEQWDWQDVADSLRKLIKSKAVTWSDLDEKSKKDVLEAAVEFLGRTTSLSEIEETLGSSKINNILNDFLKGELLRSTVKGGPITLDSDKKEKLLPYYVPRTLTLRRQLKPEIFKAKCVDVLVIQGIQRSQLFTLAYPERTDLSGNQTKEITVRFIILECDSDYDILCKKTQAPIHRIMYENDKFFWTSTTGSMKVVRQHLMENTEEISEKDMVTKKLADYNTRPIAIADCPGMGKTVLLSQISRLVAECYPKRYVLNISFQRLFASMDNYSNEMLNFPFVKRNLAKCSSCTPLGQEILFELMNCEATRFEIFLDGFDEIPSPCIPPVEHMLKLLLQSDNLRAFITTRNYMRDNIEQTIGVISWNIHPFTISDQIDFFLRYWTSTPHFENTSRLQEFVKDFVRDIQSNDLISGTNEGNDFAGIPIKCFMLAEVNAAEAQRYLTSYTTYSGDGLVMKTINELYQKFITFRFEKVSQAERAPVIQAHWKAAIQLLFPDWVDQLKEFLEPADSGSNALDSNMLLSVGILQDVNPPKFTHRTFAEYLVADLIVSNLLKKCCKNSGTKLIQFLFDAVLTTTTITCNTGYSKNLKDEFVSVLRSSTLWSQMFEELTKMSVLYNSDFVALAAVESNEDCAEKLIFCWFNFITDTNTPTYVSLVNTLQNEMQWPLDICTKLLNIPSVQRRGYKHPTVAHFINAFLIDKDAHLNFDNVVLDILEGVREYKQTNVLTRESATWFYENVSTCAETGYTNILKLLVALSVHTVDYSNLPAYNWTSPILTAVGHDVLFFQTYSKLVETLYEKCILQLDLGILELSGDPITPLHKAVEQGNYQVVEYLVSKYGKDIISMSKHLIWYCVKYSMLQPIRIINKKMEIISLLLRNTNKNILDEALHVKISEDMIQFTAITAEGIHVKLFKHLIELGADTGQTFDANVFADKVIGRFSTVDLDELVEFLAEKSLLELLFKKDLYGVCGLESVLFNSKLSPESFRKIHAFHNVSLDEYRDTYRYVVVSRWAPEMVKATVEIFNNVNLTDSRNRTLLIMAARSISLANIKYLVSVGADVNHFDDDGCSTLMAVIRKNYYLTDPDVTHECVQVLLEAGAKVNARNKFSKTLFDTEEFDKSIKLLKNETVDLLIKKSGGKYTRNNHGVITRRKCVIF